MIPCVWRTGSTQADGTSGLPEACKAKKCAGLFQTQQEADQFRCFMPVEEPLIQLTKRGVTDGNSET
jgi:hypothetical protein